MSFRKRGRVALVGLAVGLLTAAVPGVVAGGTAAAKAPSKSPILVGNLGPYTSTVLGPEELDLAATPKAWVAYTNAHGGIDGHPVKLVEINDNFDPAQAVAAAKKLIADHVVAVVYDEDVALETAYAPLLQAAGIPVVGGQDYDAVWETNPDLFPTMATVSTKGYADDTAAKFAKAKTLAESYCTESSACLEDVQAQKAASSQVGITVDIGPSAGSTQPNYTAQCEQLATYNAQAYYFSDGVAGIEHMASDCARQGYKGFWVLPQPDATELTTAALAKFTIGQDLSLPFFAKLPQTKVFRTGMAKYAPGIPLQVNSLRAWSAFDVFKQAVENEKGKPVTSANVKAGLYKLNGFNDNGLTPNLTYKPGKGTTIKCFVLWGITKGKFVLPKGDHYVCQP